MRWEGTEGEEIIVKVVILFRVLESTGEAPGILQVASKAGIDLHRFRVELRCSLSYEKSETIQRHYDARFCSEVYIGEKGHEIKTCHGFRRHAKNKLHEWTKGGINDILIPVETFHLKNMFQDVIKHDQRFDYNRIPAIVELSLQAGADINDESLFTDNLECVGAESLSNDELRLVADGTLKAWEVVRSGVEKLLMVYSAKVCKYCSDVHVGPSGHKARLCGVFKYESWRGTHLWKKAQVDDLFPSKIVWFRRPQDPVVLQDKCRSFYGHAPAVVDLCTKAGVIAPPKYYCQMKLQGLSADIPFRPRG
ncbi:APO protein 4, mitochondrial [Tanacetum coccineum]